MPNGVILGLCWKVKLTLEVVTECQMMLPHPQFNNFVSETCLFSEPFLFSETFEKRFSRLRYCQDSW